MKLSETESLDGKQLRILYVEDDLTLQVLIKRMIRIHDPSIHLDLVNSTEAALELLQEQRYDCILSDYEMGELNGIEFCYKLRETDEKTPFVLYTGKGDEDIASKAFEANADDYVKKRPEWGPADYATLVNRIKGAVEKRGMKTALQESELRYRAIFEQAAYGIAVLDLKDGSMIDFNNAAHENLGYTADEFEKINVSDFEVIENPEEVEAHLRKVVEEGGDIFETKHKTKQGDIREVLVNCKIISIGGKSFVQSMYYDITEKKQMELDLRVSETKFRTLFETSLDSIVISNYLMHGTEVNDGTVSLTGYSKEELSKMKPFDFIHPDDIEKTKVAYQNLTTKGFISNLSVRIITKSGKVKWTDLNSKAIYGENNEIIGSYDIVRDISEQKELEDLLQKSNNELQQFAHDSSHELRTPLANNIGFLNLLKEEYDHKLDPEAIELIDFATTAARDIEKTLDNLLAYAQIDNDAPTHRTNGLYVITEALQTIDLKTEKGLAKISWDSVGETQVPEQFEVVFRNLISNSMKYRSDEVLPQIHISVESREKDMLFSVEDNGIGIPDDKQEEIFQMFKRVHLTTQKGDGIGLAMCKRIVERHGGEIWMNSIFGKGSTVHFTVPHDKSFKS